MAVLVPEKLWRKPQNGQLAPKMPDFQMAENHYGTHFHIWGQNSNAWKLCIVGKEIF